MIIALFSKFPMKLSVSITAVALALFAATAASAQTQTNGEPVFPPVQQWEKALRAGDMSALRKNYSASPKLNLTGPDKNPHSLADEISFWKSFHADHRDFQLIQRESGDNVGVHMVSLTLSFNMHTPQGPRARYILEDQAWQHEGAAWKIIAAKHTGIVTMPQPTQLHKDIYPKNVDAKAEIREAIARASREHKHNVNKRIILVFGANWCYDCVVLDYVLHRPDFAALVEPFIVLHVDVGEYDKNMDLAARYKVPLDRGIPALAVLDSDGSLLYSQQQGEFNSARSMDPASLTAFLKQWKP